MNRTIASIAYRALSLGIGVSMCAGCTTRELNQSKYAHVQGERRLLFEDDFERTELGRHWSRGEGEGGTGRWILEGGEVRARDMHNDPLWLSRPLPENVRVEFDAKARSADGDLKFEIFGDGKRHESGYIVIFGGWKNSLDVIARLDEHGADRKEQRTRKVSPNTSHRLALERRDGTLTFFVDGEMVMQYQDREPLVGLKHRFFAFNGWEAPVSFDNLKVWAL
ncbi:MAG: hypothetical protein AAGI01_03580 [Myxococcota bacterium]